MHLDLASQLLAAGQCHWAFYVLQHALPTKQAALRSFLHAFHCLLEQYTPVWIQSAEQTDFIERELRVPVVWMEGAKVRGGLLRGRAGRACCLDGGCERTSAFEAPQSSCEGELDAPAAWMEAVSERVLADYGFIVNKASWRGELLGALGTCRAP